VARVEHYAFDWPDRRVPHKVAGIVIECGPPTITGAAPAPAPHKPPEATRYRVGVDVGEPTRLFAPSPVYPRAALAARLEGVVVLECTIDCAGRVADVTVLRPAPLGLTEAAVEAVRQWRFEPSTVDGEPVEVLYVLTVRFILS
jgi:protein TonB